MFSLTWKIALPALAGGSDPAWWQERARRGETPDRRVDEEGMRSRTIGLSGSGAFR